MSNVVKSVTYADAETRGRLRAWKKKVAEDYAAATAVLNGFLHSDGAAFADFVRRGSRVGKERAIEKIQSLLGPGVALETVRFDGRQSYAVWSILKPRASVTVEPSNGSTEGECRSLSQDCVTVNYVWLKARAPVEAPGQG